MVMARYRLALTIEEAGAHSFAVASLSEALELRQRRGRAPNPRAGLHARLAGAEAAAADVTLAVFDAATAAELRRPRRRPHSLVP